MVLLHMHVCATVIVLVFVKLVFFHVLKELLHNDIVVAADGKMQRSLLCVVVARLEKNSAFYFRTPIPYVLENAQIATAARIVQK